MPTLTAAERKQQRLDMLDSLFPAKSTTTAPSAPIAQTGGTNLTAAEQKQQRLDMLDSLFPTKKTQTATAPVKDAAQQLTHGINTQPLIDLPGLLKKAPQVISENIVQPFQDTSIGQDVQNAFNRQTGTNTSALPPSALASEYAAVLTPQEKQMATSLSPQEFGKYLNDNRQSLNQRVSDRQRGLQEVTAQTIEQSLTSAQKSESPLGRQVAAAVTGDARYTSEKAGRLASETPVSELVPQAQYMTPEQKSVVNKLAQAGDFKRIAEYYNSLDLSLSEKYSTAQANKAKESVMTADERAYKDAQEAYETAKATGDSAQIAQAEKAMNVAKAKMTSGVNPLIAVAKVGGSILTTGALNAFAGISGLVTSVGRTIGDAIKGTYTPINPNNQSFQLSNIAEGISAGRQQIIEDYVPDTQTVLGRTAKQWVNLATEGLSSGVTNLLQLYTGQAIGLEGEALAEFVTAVMGTGAAGQALHKNLQDNQSNTTALVNATANGLFEYWTEHLTTSAWIENLAKIKAGEFTKKAFVEMIAAQTGAEMWEEVVGNVADQSWDMIFNGRNSEFNQLTNSLLESGEAHNRDEAENMAFSQLFVQQSVDAALSVAFSMLLMDGAPALGNHLSFAQAGSNLRKESPAALQSEIYKGKLFDEDTNAYKLATQAEERVNRGATVSDAELGRLAFWVGNAANNLFAEISETEVGANAFARAVERIQSYPNAKIDVGAIRAAQSILQNIRDGKLEQQTQTTATTTQTEPQAQVTVPVPSTSTNLGEIATRFVQDAGLPANIATQRENIIRQLMTDGERVTDREINKLDPTDRRTRQIFSDVTGVSIPESLSGIDRPRLYEIYRSASQSPLERQQTTPPTLATVPETAPTIPQAPVTPSITSLDAQPLEQNPAVQQDIMQGIPQPSAQSIQPEITDIPPAIPAVSSPQAIPEAAPDVQPQIAPQETQIVSDRSPLEDIRPTNTDVGYARESSPVGEPADRLVNQEATSDVVSSEAAPADTVEQATTVKPSAQPVYGIKRMGQKSPKWFVVNNSDGKAYLAEGEREAKKFDTPEEAQAMADNLNNQEAPNAPTDSSLLEGQEVNTWAITPPPNRYKIINNGTARFPNWIIHDLETDRDVVFEGQNKPIGFRSKTAAQDYANALSGLPPVPKRVTPGRQEQTDRRNAANYKTFTRLFPEFANGQYKWAFYEASGETTHYAGDAGFIPLRLQYVNDTTISIGHILPIRNTARVYRDPQINYRIDKENGTLIPLYYIQDTSPQVETVAYDEDTGKYNSAAVEDLSKFTKDWFKQIKSNGYVLVDSDKQTPAETLTESEPSPSNNTSEPVQAEQSATQEEPTANVPRVMPQTSFAEQYPLDVSKYNEVKSKYPGYLVGIRFDGETIEPVMFYGADATKAAKGTTSVQRTETIPGLGETQITIFHGMADALNQLVDKKRGNGYKVVIAREGTENPNAPYEILKVRDKRAEARQDREIKRAEREARTDEMLHQAEETARQWDIDNGIAPQSEQEATPLEETTTTAEPAAQPVKEDSQDERTGNLEGLDDGDRVEQSPVLREGTGGVGTQVEAETLQTPESNGATAEPLPNGGEQNRQLSGRKRNRNGTGRSNGNDNGTVLQQSGAGQPGDDGGLTEAAQTETAQKQQTEIQQKTVTAQTVDAKNFVIPESGLDAPTTQKARTESNLAAIRTMKTIIDEGRKATPEEQATLSKYTGWGGLTQVFDESHSEFDSARNELHELLTDDEYASARATILNAYYTPIDVIRAIYSGLEHLGFKGGKVLDPSAGVGHFTGAMPESVKTGTHVTMYELDTVSGNIAKLLYPDSQVFVKGFETTRLPDNSFDIAITNVPFGSEGVADSSITSKVAKSTIHNYFFAKALEKVRPGGIVAFITSAGTLDSKSSHFRDYLARKADLLGAIRLPNTTFKGTGTGVISDIIILQKHSPGTTSRGGEAFLKGDAVLSKAENRGYFLVNEYFVNHPDMILGEPAYVRGQYGNVPTFNPLKTETPLSEQIKQAFDKISGRMTYPERKNPHEINLQARIANNSGRNKPNSLVRKDGKIYRVEVDEEQGTVLTEEKVSQKAFPRVDGLLRVRDAAQSLLDLQRANAAETQKENSRKVLNSIYDEFVKDYGDLHSRTNAPVLKNKIGVDAPFMLALENVGKNGEISKAPVFERDTIVPPPSATRADTIEDALTISINESGTINPERIGELLGVSSNEAYSQLVESGLAFATPDGLVPRAKYLSGNVRAKLYAARELASANPEYQRNVDALEKVLPADVPFENINVALGATWIPTTIYSRFVASLLGASRFANDINISYNQHTGLWSLSTRGLAYNLYSSVNTSEWGTSARTLLDNNKGILVSTLNNQLITITRDKAIDAEATTAAQQKQQKLRDEFQRWWREELTKSPSDVAAMTRLYNDTNNNWVSPEYDGSTLTFPGMSSAVGLRDYQKNAVMRIIMEQSTLLAHAVGKGKTFTMATAAMKLRQLGLANKPMIVAPKPVVAQWGKEFLKLYPSANVLVIEKFGAKERKTFVNRIMLGDYDAVILSNKAFEAIPMSTQAQRDFFTEILNDLIESQQEAAREKEKSNVRDLETQIKNMRTRLEQLENRSSKDEDNIDFESLGVDALFVDESQDYKNLFFKSTRDRIAGLGNREGSGRAFDMYMKSTWLHQQNGRFVFATGTPVMNSISEIYSLLRYFSEDQLRAMGIHSFDAWAAQFAEETRSIGRGLDGKFQIQTTLSAFRNANQLKSLVGTFMDTQLEPVKTGVPEMLTGDRIVEASPPSEHQKEQLQTIYEKAQDKKNNRLALTTMLRYVGLSQRVIDRSLPYEEDGKIMTAIRNIHQIWNETKSNKGVQLVFLDWNSPNQKQLLDKNGDPTGNDPSDDMWLYKDIKRELVDRGVPEKEIAFINDYSTDEQKNKLSVAVNDGEIRIVLGSSKKLGVGWNLQTRIAAMHHIDAPFRPGDLTQRNGRGLRFGNMYPEVAVIQYVTEDTGDALIWSKLLSKERMIEDFLSGRSSDQVVELGDDALSYAEISAAASGNPLLKELYAAQQEVGTLELLQRAYTGEQANTARQIETATRNIDGSKAYLENMKADIKKREDVTGTKFKIVIDGKTFTDRTKAGQALLSAVASVTTNERDNVEKKTKIGTFAGFNLFASSTGELVLQGKGQYRVAPNTENPLATTTRLQNAATGIDTNIKNTQAAIATRESQLAELEKKLNTPFDRADELKAARDKLADLQQKITDRTSQQDDTPRESDKAPKRKPLPHMATPVQSGQVQKLKTPSARGNVQKEKKREKRSRRQPDANPERWTAEQIKTTQDVIAEIRKQNPQTAQEMADIIDGKKQTTLSDIVETIRHEWGIVPGRGIQITTGHTAPDALGQYSKGNKGIRARVTNDLPTISHELGHHIDDIYKFTDSALSPEATDELVRNLGNDFNTEEYEQSELKAEGFAEFVRRFLQNRELAQVDYKQTYPEFMQELSGRHKAQILADSIRVNKYYADMPTNVPERGDPVPDARTLGEKARDNLRHIQARFADGLAPVRELSQMYESNVHEKFYNLPYSESKAAGILQGDLYGIDGQYIAPGIRHALRDIRLNNRAEFKAFGDYVIALRASTLIPRGIRVYANDAQNTVDYAKSQIEKLEKQYPKFKESAERLREFWHAFGQEYFVNSGLMSQELFDELWKLDPYYSPFQRVIEKAGHKGKTSSSGSPINRIKGSGRDIYNPVDNMISLVPRIVTLAMDNAAKAELANLADEKGIDATWMERIEAPAFPVSVDLKGRYADIKQGVQGKFNKEQLGVLLDAMENAGELMTVWVRGNPQRGTVTIYRNGQAEYWKINDVDLYDALSRFDRDTMNGITKVWGRLSREFTQNVTGRLFVWSLTHNALSDIQTAEARLKSTKIGDHVKLIGYIAKAWAGRVKETVSEKGLDPFHAEWLAMGGMNMFDGASISNKNLAKQTRKQWQPGKMQRFNILANTLNTFDWISKTVENGPREATYIMYRKQGYEPYQAFRAAMEITTDFKISGEWSRQLNAVFPFFNAQVQGFTQDMALLTGQDVPPNKRLKTAAGRLTFYGLISAITAALHYLLNNWDDDDKENYERLSTFVKNSYWTIPKGDGGYISIRKGRELAILDSFIERTLETYINGNEDAFYDFGEYALGEMLPSVIADLVRLDVQGAVGDISVIGAVHNIGINKNFLGNPIVSSALVDLAPHLQYSGNTSAAAKAIADTAYKVFGIELSPQQIDYFNQNGNAIPFFGGAIWTYIKEAFPVDPAKADFTLGLRAWFNKDSLYSNDIVNWLYDRRDKTSMDAKSYPDNIRAKFDSKLDEAETNFYSRYYTLARDLPETEENRRLRILVLDRIKTYKDSIESGQLTKTQQAILDVCEYAGTTSDLLPRARDTTIKGADGLMHTLTAKQYYDYNGYYEQLYLDIAGRTLQKITDKEQQITALEKAAKTAGEMSLDYARGLIGAQSQDDTLSTYDTLSLYRIDVADYVTAYSATQGISSYKETKRNGKTETISDSGSALKREAIEELFDNGALNYPDTQKDKLMEILGVSKTVRGWSRTTLDRKLARMREKADAA